MQYVKNVYAAYSKNLETRLQSSSGGMFTVFAEYILARSGVVYGVAMSDDCYSAVFIRTTESNELERIRTSKYLQAKVGDTFKQVKMDLLNERLVLFTGTGCQVNGLKRFLGKDYKNLYCMDIVCHGVPSQKLWSEYAKYQESRFQSKLNYINFRSKDKNHWESFDVKEIAENQKEIYLSHYTDLYYQLFSKDVCLRPSCYFCAAKKEKLSDITVADFWGIDQVAPEMNDDNGVSLVITRTKKGQELLDDSESDLVLRPVTYKQGVRKNKSEYKSNKKPKERDKFYQDLDKMPFEKLCRQYTKPSVKEKVKKLIKNVIHKK